jgi:hypothetical protein
MYNITFFFTSALHRLGFEIACAWVTVHCLLDLLACFLRGGRVEREVRSGNIDKVHINFIHNPTLLIHHTYLLLFCNWALGLVFYHSTLLCPSLLGGFERVHRRERIYPRYLTRYTLYAVRTAWWLWYLGAGFSFVMGGCLKLHDHSKSPPSFSRSRLSTRASSSECKAVITEGWRGG